MQGCWAPHTRTPTLTSHPRSQEVKEGSYIRVHASPRRFPAAWAADWPARILGQGEGFVVVDKPAGVPVHATVDNRMETVVARVQEALPSLGELSCPHRLDCDVSGVLLLASDAGFLRYFNKLQIKGKVG